MNEWGTFENVQMQFANKSAAPKLTVWEIVAVVEGLDVLRLEVRQLRQIAILITSFRFHCKRKVNTRVRTKLWFLLVVGSLIIIFDNLLMVRKQGNWWRYCPSTNLSKFPPLPLAPYSNQHIGRADAQISGSQLDAPEAKWSCKPWRHDDGGDWQKIYIDCRPPPSLPHWVKR